MLSSSQNNVWAMGTVFALLLVAHDHFLYKEPEKE